MSSRTTPQKRGLDLFVETYRLTARIDRGLRRTTTHTTIVSDSAYDVRQLDGIEVWTTEERIGRGISGDVYLQTRSNGDARAVKVLKKPSDTNRKQELLRELVYAALFTKDHASFLLFKGWYELDDRLYLAMEYFELGNLESCLSQNCLDPLTEPEAKIIISQVAEALRLLHARGLTHQRLDPQNVFVRRKGPQWWVKLGDFGISRGFSRDDTAQYSQYCGHFAAPEFRMVIGPDNDGLEPCTFTNAADIWSLGCLTYWLLTRHALFSDARSLGRYCEGLGRPPTEAIQMRISDSGLEILHRCLAVQPGDRPTTQDILTSKWLCDTSSVKGPDGEKGPNGVTSNAPSFKPSPALLSEIDFNFRQDPSVLNLADRPKIFPTPMFLFGASEPLQAKNGPGNERSQTKSPFGSHAGSTQPRKLKSIRATRDLAQSLQELSELQLKITSRNALVWATQRGYLALAQLILNNNHHLDLDYRLVDKDVHTGEASSMSALHYLAMTQGEDLGETVTALLAKRVDVEARDHAERTPLIIAAEAGNIEVANLLLKKGARVEAQTKLGVSALMEASQHGHLRLAECLITAGTSLAASDHLGRTPLMYAAMAGRMAVSRLLIVSGALLEARDSYERTPLMLAALNGHDRLIYLLLAAGAKVNAQDKSARTAVDLARLGKHSWLAGYLVKAGALHKDGEGQKEFRDRRDRLVVVRLPGHGPKSSDSKA